ncbi:MAG: hypothetical protein QOI83_2038 [Streptomycetaceae bacterium]|nr:hypothetical protein [Streptomycetaceae bacterium]
MGRRQIEAGWYLWWRCSQAAFGRSEAHAILACDSRVRGCGLTCPDAIIGTRTARAVRRGTSVVQASNLCSPICQDADACLEGRHKIRFSSDQRVQDAGVRGGLPAGAVVTKSEALFPRLEDKQDDRQDRQADQQ